MIQEVLKSFKNTQYFNRNLIGSGRAPNMGDGWETARRLDRPAVLAKGESEVLEIPGYEWCAFKLGIRGTVSLVEVDTNHFKVSKITSLQILRRALIGTTKDGYNLIVIINVTRVSVAMVLWKYN